MSCACVYTHADQQAAGRLSVSPLFLCPPVFFQIGFVGNEGQKVGASLAVSVSVFLRAFAARGGRKMEGCLGKAWCVSAQIAFRQDQHTV